MKIKTAKIFSNYFKLKISSKEFEEWLYSNDKLEDEIGEENYEFLISIDYKNKHSRNKIQGRIDSLINYDELNINEISKLVDRILKKEIFIIDGLIELYQYLELDYEFLENIEILSSFNEQGKSIKHKISKDMSADTIWEIVIKNEPDFVEKLIDIKNHIGRLNDY